MKFRALVKWDTSSRPELWPNYLPRFCRSSRHRRVEQQPDVVETNRRSFRPSDGTRNLNQVPIMKLTAFLSGNHFD